MTQPLTPLGADDPYAAVATASSSASSPPRSVTPRSPKGGDFHPNKSAAITKMSSPRRTSEPGGSSPVQRSSLRLLNNQTNEPLKNSILQAIEQVGQEPLAIDRLIHRCSLFILLAGAAKYDETDRESALQKATHDIRRAYSDCSKPHESAVAQVAQLRSVCKVVEEFELYSGKQPNRYAPEIAQIGLNCLELIRQLEGDSGK